jgi:hypothetical protein
MNIFDAKSSLCMPPAIIVKVYRGSEEAASTWLADH